MPRDWSADVYERVSAPQEAMGRATLERLALRGDETVLDAGCGTGRVTARLAERLPRGRIVAVDGSQAMIERARARFAGDPRIELRVMDLLELELDDPVDAIISTATFHWIADHEELFRRLGRALKTGGRMVFQCGGAGNIATLVGAVERVVEASERFAGLRGWSPWNFAGVEDTQARLRDAGFGDVRAWLQPWPVEVDDPVAYYGTVSLGSHLERLPPDQRGAFVDAVLEAMPEPRRLDYVRLNVDAGRP